MIHKHKYTKAVILVGSPFKLYGSCFDLDITGDHKGVATKEQYDSMCDFKPLIWKKMCLAKHLCNFDMRLR